MIRRVPLAGVLIMVGLGSGVAMGVTCVDRVRGLPVAYADSPAQLPQEDRVFLATERPVMVAAQEVNCPRGHADRIRIFADSQGRFSVRGSINGKAVTFVVDFSIDDIQIGSRTAQRLGAVIQRGRTRPLIDSEERILANFTVLQQMRIDGWAWERIPAWIVERSETEVRIGRGFLGQFQVRTLGNSLILEGCR